MDCPSNDGRTYGSFPSFANKKRIPKGIHFLLAEDEGYNRNSVNGDLSVDASAERSTPRLTPTKNAPKWCAFVGGGRGIRTPVGVNPNGFQDRLVMTASIVLRIIRIKKIVLKNYSTRLLYIELVNFASVFNKNNKENLKSL